MSQPPEMHHWLPWSELAGGPPLTVEQFRSALQLYPRSALLISCARVSILFNYGPDANTVASKESTAKWAPHMFAPNHLPRLLQALAQGRPIFFQAQLRYLVAQAMRLDPTHEEDGTKIPDIALGALLLGAGELLYKPHINDLPDDLDVMANLVADFLPTYEIDPLTDPFMLYLRFYIFLKIITPRLPDHIQQMFDVPAIFEKAFGFPLKLYSQFVYAFIVHAMQERSEKPPDTPPPDGGLHISWFKKTILTPQQVSNMFDTVCCRLSDLPDRKQVHGYADFEYLKDHPYLRVEDKLYALDYEFAVAKLESGALWRVAMAMPSKQRPSYFGYWGEVFEEYVKWIFESYADKIKNHLHSSPMYLKDKDNKPICDIIIVCGSTAVLIETKLGTCSAEVRYSGDYKKFRDYMEKSLVTGSDRPIGVSQLLTAIDNICSMSPDTLPTWLRGIRKIIPVIITKDEIGSSWMTNAYLNARFQQKLSKRRCKPRKVTPLVSMNVSTLERAIPAMNEMAFSDIMEDRIQEDPMLGRPFEAASSFVQRGTPGRLYKHIEIMHELSKEMQQDFEMKDDSSSTDQSSPQ